MLQITKQPDSQTTRPLRIAVGLSGGVDSSVTAALLKQQGYDVIGVYMKNWNIESPTLGDRRLSPDEYRLECPWYEDYLDAKRVALQLEIPFYMWDFREAYKTKVFDEFLDDIEKGRTPNPDIYCNSRVKFEDFLEKAVAELGVDCVATGHYARKVTINQSTYCLQIPNDTRKDQSYFLYRLSQAQLAKTLFPLADYTKEQVRTLAEQMNLPTKYKKDSQGICFIGQVEIRQFLSQWLAPKPGQIVDETGRVIGDHQGVHLYTIGEKIAVNTTAVARYYPELKHQLPIFYVAAKDIQKNVITAVAGSENPALYKKSVWLEQPVSTDPEADPKAWSSLRARVRHGGALVAVAELAVGQKQSQPVWQVVFEEPQRALAPGQHLVLYDADDRVVGGGKISINN